jgi:aspartate/methionine/tyrosine aminotransferase
MKIEDFALERWLTRHELHVKYDIAESGILPLKLNDLLAFESPDDRVAILEHLLELRLGYNEAVGTRELRTVIASTYENIDPDNVLVTTGAIEANFLLFNVLLDAGNHVIAPYPAYQQLFSVPRAIGCDVSLWKITPENDFCYDLDALRRLVTPKTRLIILNTPHNPTGAILPESDLREVYSLAERVGATVLCDEAYRWLSIPGGESFAPPICTLGSNGISVGTISKPFGLPGLRLGWMVAPKEIISKCWAMRDYVSLSPGKLNDAIAILAFKHREKIIERNSAIISANLDEAHRWVAHHTDILSWKPPRGGLLALIKYQIDITSLELADKLATEYSVMLAPGSSFGYENYLRMGIGQNPGTFKSGLEAASRCFLDIKSN